MQNFKKNLLISIKRSLQDNELALGISLGLLIACIGLLIIHMQEDTPAIHAAPSQQQDFWIEDEFYQAPGRAVSFENNKDPKEIGIGFGI